MHVRRFLIFAMLSVVFAGIAPDGALACSCLRQTHSEHLQGIDFVAFGRIVSVVQEKKTQKGQFGPRGRAKFAPKQTWKGTPGELVEIRYHVDTGGDCGVDFEKGEEFIMFALANADGTYQTGLCIIPPTWTWMGGEADNYTAVLDDYKARWDKLRAAVKAQPNSLSTHIRLAEFLESERDRPGALASYEKIASLDPKNPIGPAGAGRVLFDLKNYKGALVKLRRATELDPDNQDTRRLIQHARLHLGEKLDFRQVDLRGLKLSGVDFSGLDLRGKNFSGAELWYANFTGSQLDGAVLDRADLFRADFTGASAKGSDIRNTRMTRAIFANADFSSANAMGTHFSGTDLAGANMTGIAAQYSKFDDVNVEGTNFNGANLAHSRFRDMRLAGASFSDASLNNARFYHADLSGVDLSTADLHRARLKGAKYDCATRLPAGVDVVAQKMIPTERGCSGIAVNLDFRFADWESHDLSGLDLHGADFSGSILEYAQFYGANLEGANFSDTFMAGYFGGANLRHSNFTNARQFPSRWDFNGDAGHGRPDITGAVFRNVSLDLRLFTGMAEENPDLETADLSGSTIVCGRTPEWIVRQSGDVPRQNWVQYQSELSLAKILVAAQPDVRLDAACAAAIDKYSGKNCAPWIAKDKRPRGCVFPEPE